MIAIRAASPEDAEAVGTLLRAAYPPLLASAYAPELLNQALPFLTRPIPALLTCGTWYLAETGEGTLLGCGGWTRSPPANAKHSAAANLGHLRHFATHPDHVRRGIGRAIFARCLADARTAQLHALECEATVAAEPFYRALGFLTLTAIDVKLGGRLDFPGLRMRLHLDEA